MPLAAQTGRPARPISVANGAVPGQLEEIGPLAVTRAAVGAKRHTMLVMASRPAKQGDAVVNMSGRA